MTACSVCSGLIIEAAVSFRIVLRSVGRDPGEFKPLFNIPRLPCISKNSEPDAESVCELFP